MSHMVDRMMYAGEVPWHGLGISLPDKCDGDTLRDLVFDWRVEKRPVYVSGKQGANSDYKAFVRSDNFETLCIMPNTFGLVQHQDALSLLDAAVGQGEAQYITAGTLDGGRRGWALATVPSCTMEIAGAELKPYLLMSNAHDGSRACRVLFTSVYVVCNNTETWALQQAGALSNKRLPNVLTIKHTKHADERVRVAAGLIGTAKEYFGTFHEAALRLTVQRFTTTDMRFLCEHLFPSDPDTGVPTDRTFDTRAKVVSLYEGGQRASAQAPGTKWAALNAVTEFVDHHTARRGKDAVALAEGRFKGTFEGTGAVLRQRAYDYLAAA